MSLQPVLKVTSPQNSSRFNSIAGVFQKRSSLSFVTSGEVKT
jgi:hypothetical protein